MKQDYYIKELFLRYSILLIVAIPNFYLFYLIFTPLTIYPVYFILDLLFNSSLIGNTLILSSKNIEIIEACVAGSAYYFLLFLNLSTPIIKIKKRIKIILSSFLILLIVNILRILLLAFLFIYNFKFFYIAHKIFWYFLSTLFVVFIWFFIVKKFKIKEIPFYSDLRYLYLKSVFGKNKK